MKKSQKNPENLSALNQREQELLAQIEARRNKEDAQLAELRAKREAIEKAEITELVVAIDQLPEQLGTQTLEEAVILIRQRLSGKGVFAKLSLDAAARRTYTVLTPEQRAAIVEKLSNGAQPSALMKEFGVSSTTIHNIKAEAGLVKHRANPDAPAPAAAPAS